MPRADLEGQMVAQAHQRGTRKRCLSVAAGQADKPDLGEDLVRARSPLACALNSRLVI
jgi:hypothetical protein